MAAQTKEQVQASLSGLCTKLLEPETPEAATLLRVAELVGCFETDRLDADTLALASMEGTSDAQVDGMVAAHLAGLVDRAQAVVQRLTSVQAGREAARGAHSASSSVESLPPQPRPPARGKAAARSVASPRKVRRKTRPTVATAASKPVTAVRIPPELRKGGVTRMSARKAQAAGGMDGGGGGTGMDGWVLGTGATPN